MTSGVSAVEVLLGLVALVLATIGFLTGQAAVELVGLVLGALAVGMTLARFFETQGASDGRR